MWKGILAVTTIFAGTLILTPAGAKVRYVTIKGEKMLSTSSGGRDSNGTSRASECLTPRRGGRLLKGSGNVTDAGGQGSVAYYGRKSDGTVVPGDPTGIANVGWWVTKDTPQEICIEAFARTSATETNVNYHARAVATERYGR